MNALPTACTLPISKSREQTTPEQTTPEVWGTNPRGLGNKPQRSGEQTTPEVEVVSGRFEQATPEVEGVPGRYKRITPEVEGAPRSRALRNIAGRQSYEQESSNI